jgi:dihydroorotase
MSAILFANATGVDRKPLEVRVESGRITEVAPRVTRKPDDRIEDLGGAVLAPAFFDPHVHFREPGEAYKETLETGSRAAAAGGYSDVAVMPNTNPALDEAYRVRGVIARAREIGLCRVHAIGACTLGLAGERLTEMAALLEAGAIGFSDDGKPVAQAARMRRAMEWARGLGAVIVTHAEDLSLRGDGVMHEGATATRLGLAGIPAATETVAIARDLELAALTGSRLHVAHVSTARSAELIRDAKRRGLAVSAETAPHYLLFTDEDVARLGTAAKMNPPLRTASDREALVAAVCDGTIDCLATDHAPHTTDEKAQPFADAPMGVVGLETALAAALTVLHHQAGMPLAQVIDRLTRAPRAAFGLEQHTIAPGQPADLVAFDPEAEWTVEPDKFATKGRATPFAGARLKGRVLGTWLEGRETFRATTQAMAGVR